MTTLDTSVAAMLAEMLPGPDEDSAALRAQALPVAVFLLNAPTGNGSFELRVGPYDVDLNRAAVQAAASAALLAVVTNVAGSESLPVALVALVLPFLVDLDRVELRPSERIVLAALREAALVSGNSAEWYDDLPQDLRDQITRLEFADLLERLRSAGEVVTRGDSNALKGEHVWRLPLF